MRRLGYPVSRSSNRLYSSCCSALALSDVTVHDHQLRLAFGVANGARDRLQHPPASVLMLDAVLQLFAHSALARLPSRLQHSHAVVGMDLLERRRLAQLRRAVAKDPSVGWAVIQAPAFDVDQGDHVGPRSRLLPERFRLVCGVRDTCGRAATLRTRQEPPALPLQSRPKGASISLLRRAIGKKWSGISLSGRIFRKREGPFRFRILHASKQHLVPHCTVKAFALVEVPPALLTETFPLVAPDGTATRMKFAVSTAKLALWPLIITAVVPTKCDP